MKPALATLNRPGLTSFCQVGSTAGRRLGRMQLRHRGAAQCRNRDVTTNACPRSGSICRCHRRWGKRRGGQGGPESQPPTRPGGAAVHDQSPPRDFSPRGVPTAYFWDPDIIAVDPSFNDLARPNTAIKRLHAGAVVGRRPGMEFAGALHAVERHSQQPADAMVGG